MCPLVTGLRPLSPLQANSQLFVRKLIHSLTLRNSPDISAGDCLIKAHMPAQGRVLLKKGWQPPGIIKGVINQQGTFTLCWERPAQISCREEAAALRQQRLYCALRCLHSGQQSRRCFWAGIFPPARRGTADHYKKQDRCPYCTSNPPMTSRLWMLNFRTVSTIFSMHVFGRVLQKKMANRLNADHPHEALGSIHT